MASPKIEVFFIYNATTGAPQSGLTPTFSKYTNEVGTTVTQPAISDLGGGAYGFTPVFPNATHGIIYVINTTAAPLYIGRYMRPEDWNDDNADVTSSSIITSIKGTQGIDLSSIAGGVSFNPTTDNLDALRTAIAAIPTSTTNVANAVWDTLRGSHIGNGTFGEAIRVLYQVARGHTKVDKFSNKLIVYAEDGTTPLYQCDLLRNGFPASIHADERLAGA